MSQNPQRPSRPSGSTIIAILVAVSVAAIYLINSGGMAYLLPDLLATAIATPQAVEEAAVAAVPAQPADQEPEVATGAAGEKAAPTATIPAEINGIPTIRYDELPPEAHDTIALIEQNGPFPYDKDGAVFENREGILPSRPRAYYREYTVITPGEDDRGARRIVTGGESEFYYTDDHYESFSRVVR
jgi:ribonuclease T1